MLKVTSSAKSPRIEPGAASTGLVAPISWRAAGDRFGALEHHRDQRAAGDEGDQLAEEGLLGVLGVVLVGDRLVGLHRLQRGDPQALALEAGDHLAGQGALEGVRLDEDQGPAHGWGSFAVGLGLRRRLLLGGARGRLFARRGRGGFCGASRRRSRRRCAARSARGSRSSAAGGASAGALAPRRARPARVSQ